jgi:hypothetical protein
VYIYFYVAAGHDDPSVQFNPNEKVVAKFPNCGPSAVTAKMDADDCQKIPFRIRSMLSDPTVLILMYFVLPVWLLAGFADWLCHRASHIETTTGPKESLIRLLMFAEAAGGNVPRG